jgi:hypothetical protein
MTNFNAPSSALLSTYDSARRIFLYVRRIEARSAALLRDLELDLLNGGHNHVNLRREAHQMRNDVLNEMRKWSTPLGKAFSRALKEEGLTYGRILEKYLLQLNRPNNYNATALTGIIGPKERFRAAGRGIVDGARWRVTNGLAPNPFNPPPPHLGLAMATSPEGDPLPVRTPQAGGDEPRRAPAQSRSFSGGDQGLGPQQLDRQPHFVG